MSRSMLWVITVVLALGFIFIKFVYMPGRQTPLRQHGKREHGTVQVKDSMPGSDDQMTYTVTFIYPDAQNKNHQVTISMLDKGRWDDLKINGDVIVYYMPENPDKASIEGGEGLAAPHSSALSFLAWSMLIAGAITGFTAWKQGASEPKKPKPTGKVTVARH